MIPLSAMSAGQFRRRGLESDLHRLDDLQAGIGQRLGGLGLGDADFPRHALHQVAALDLDGQALAVDRRAGGADLLLDPLGGGLADQRLWWRRM
jgi:hypothetical protein